MLARVRGLIKDADPNVVEEWKWRGVPVWEHDGIIFTGETYKAVVKLTFAKGAALDDPSCLFNSSLEGNVRRAIDIREGEKINEKALKALIRAAVALNTAKKKTKSAEPRPTAQRGTAPAAIALIIAPRRQNPVLAPRAVRAPQAAADLSRPLPANPRTAAASPCRPGWCRPPAG